VGSYRKKARIKNENPSNLTSLTDGVLEGPREKRSNVTGGQTHERVRKLKAGHIGSKTQCTNVKEVVRDDQRGGNGAGPRRSTAVPVCDGTPHQKGCRGPPVQAHREITNRKGAMSTKAWELGGGRGPGDPDRVEKNGRRAGVGLTTTTLEPNEKKAMTKFRKKKKKLWCRGSTIQSRFRKGNRPGGSDQKGGGRRGMSGSDTGPGTWESKTWCPGRGRAEPGPQ